MELTSTMMKSPQTLPLIFYANGREPIPTHLNAPSTSQTEKKDTLISIKENVNTIDTILDDVGRDIDAKLKRNDSACCKTVLRCTQCSVYLVRLLFVIMGTVLGLGLAHFMQNTDFSKFKFWEADSVMFEPIDNALLSFNGTDGEFDFIFADNDFILANNSSDSKLKINTSPIVNMDYTTESTTNVTSPSDSELEAEFFSSFLAYNSSDNKLIMKTAPVVNMDYTTPQTALDTRTMNQTLVPTNDNTTNLSTVLNTADSTTETEYDSDDSTTSTMSVTSLLDSESEDTSNSSEVSTTDSSDSSDIESTTTI